jgi:hypothetical protein
MPLYRNPDFRRLPSGLADLFLKRGHDSFFALPGWYDLMARHGVPASSEIRLYPDEQATAAVILTQITKENGLRTLASLTNAHSLEHGILYSHDTGLETGLAAIVAEILAERPRWDCLAVDEFDPCDPSYSALVEALRGAGLLVERSLSSTTWYEETAGLGFADYLAARPSALRNTWRRKRRKLERSVRLTKSFFVDANNIDRAIADYETVYAASWKPPEFFRSFVPGQIRLAAEMGALRLGIYYADGDPTAAQLWIVWNGRAVICKLAHDQRFDDLSPGTVLTMEMFERVLSDDRPREISLGRGDDAYKKLWLPKRRERWGITAANPRTLRGLRFGLRRQAAVLYHRLRGEPVSPLG